MRRNGASRPAEDHQPRGVTDRRAPFDVDEAVELSFAGRPVGRFVANGREIHAAFPSYGALSEAVRGARSGRSIRSTAHSVGRAAELLDIAIEATVRGRRVLRIDPAQRGNLLGRALGSPTATVGLGAAFAALVALREGGSEGARS